jgi:hypothetical protein
MKDVIMINGWYVGILYTLDEMESFIEETYCQCIN